MKKMAKLILALILIYIILVTSVADINQGEGAAAFLSFRGHATLFNIESR